MVPSSHPLAQFKLKFASQIVLSIVFLPMVLALAALAQTPTCSRLVPPRHTQSRQDNTPHRRTLLQCKTLCQVTIRLLCQQHAITTTTKKHEI